MLCYKQHVQLAALQGHVSIVKMLIEKGAYLDQRDKKFGSTPLHCACLRKHDAIKDILIKAGADRTIKNRRRVLAEDIRK